MQKVGEKVMDAKIKAQYDKDTFRCHRYLIEESEGVKGTIYIDKDKDVPKEIVIKLMVKQP